MYHKKLQNALNNVQKPSRYIGNELNSIHKEGEGYVKFAFCFPDVYEVAMSHLGMKIIYKIMNERTDTLCERAFTPWTDMVEQMYKLDFPLLSLESGKPLADFDIVGFTMQYEMSYTNILLMLKLARIPLLAGERGEDMPFVCVGGPCAFNCEPIADFIDFAVLGDAEEVMCDLIEEYKKWRASGECKIEFLRSISSIRGIYVPSFYDIDYNADGTIASVKPNTDCAPATVRKAVLKDLNQSEMPCNVIVPFMETVHDRIQLEIFRGCIRGCRFCQAGYIYRPKRERSVDVIVDAAKELIANTGYEEMSLFSLSTSDYSHLTELCDELLTFTDEKKVSLSLPSLRIDSFSAELLKKTQKVRKSGLTFAPEAGTQRMRDVINKNVTEENLMNAVRTAFEAGYGNIKLYFMLGLPNETEDDIAGIAYLAKSVLNVYHQTPRELRAKSVKITVSTSVFVPKAFTPFQWEAFDSNAKDKQSALKSLITAKQISYNYHQSEVSYLEAVFARGDRRLSGVLLSAFENGCMFDGWSEFFDFNKWMDAFRVHNIDPDFYAVRKRGFDEVLPWDHIDIGVTKDYLMKECERAHEI